MKAIIDATLRARAPRGALSVASTRSIGGFPGRFSTSGSEVWDEEDISISFQLLHGPTIALSPYSADSLRKGVVRPCKCWPSLPNSKGALLALDRQVQESADRA